MARIRTIKPEFHKHEDLSELPAETHLLAAALLNYADDEGYFNANPRLVQAECCPLRDLSVSVHDSLISLVEIGYLKMGMGEHGKTYGYIVNFLEHQVINRPKPSKIKGMQIPWDAYRIDHTQISEPSPPEGKGREQGKEGNRESTLSGLSEPDCAQVLAKNVPEIPDVLLAGNFGTLWRGWQAHNMPKGPRNKAMAEWTRHVTKPGVDELMVLAKADAYFEQCRRTDTKTAHVRQWLKDHRWEDDYDPPFDAGKAVDAALHEKWSRENDDHEAGHSPHGDQAAGGELQAPVRQIEGADPVRGNGGRPGADDP